ncbi:MAG: hypothetical protein AB8H03_07770 [Saprospiraceae bacterium]
MYANHRIISYRCVLTPSIVLGAFSLFRISSWFGCCITFIWFGAAFSFRYLIVYYARNRLGGYSPDRSHLAGEFAKVLADPDFAQRA